MVTCARISTVTCARNISKETSKIHEIGGYCDISAISVFETSISEVLNNGEIDEREFQVLQELHLKVINELASVDRKMELET